MSQHCCAAGLVKTSGQQYLPKLAQVRAIAFAVCRATYAVAAGAAARAATQAVPTSVQEKALAVEAEVLHGSATCGLLPTSPIPSKKVIDAAAGTLKATGLGASTAQDQPSESSAERLLITPAIEDELDKQGVSNEKLEAWRAQETKAYDCARGPHAACKHPDVPRVPPVARDLALRFMQHFVQLMSLPSKSWFEAQVLLDAYIAKAPSSFGVHDLPATCVVLVRMLKKVDNATVCMKGARFSANAQSLAQILRARGFNVPDPTEEQLHYQELAIIQAMDWQIYLPTVESWMCAFCSRFNVITQGLFMASLVWIWEQSQFFRMTVVMREVSEASSSALPPRKVAAGLLGLRFLSARLLPIEALQPEEVSYATWQQLVATTHREDGGVPSCVLTPEIAQRVLELLQVATGLTLEELREATEHVALVLRDAFEDFHSAQQQQRQQLQPQHLQPQQLKESFADGHLVRARV